MWWSEILNYESNEAWSEIMNYGRYLLKASIASKGVIIGVKNSLLSIKAVCGQET